MVTVMNSIQWHRNSKKIYIYNSIIAIKNLIFYFSVYKGIIKIFKFQGNILTIFNYFVIIICSMMLFKRITEYFVIRYSLSKDNLVIKKGIFNIQTYEFTKKNVNKYISNIRFKSNFIQKILNIVQLDILLQNGENGGTIRISALKPECVNTIQEWFNEVSDFKYKNNDEKNQQNFSDYTVLPKYIFISSLLSANYFFLIPLVLEIQEWLERFHIEIVNISFLYNKIYITLPLFFLILFLYTFIKQYLKFGNFFMKQDQYKFYIKNGFFNDDTNIVEKDKIKGLIIEQSLGMRLLNLSTIAVITINNGELHDTQSKNYLFPFIKNQDIKEYINNYFQEYKIIDEVVPQERKLLITDIIQCLSIFIIVFIICIELSQYIPSSFSYVLLIILLLLIPPVLKKFTSRLFINEQQIQIKSGFLNTQTYLLLNENIECLDIKILEFKKKILRRNIKITLHSTPVKKIRAMGVPLNTVNKITEKLSK